MTAVVSSLYGALAAWRRQWYARHAWQSRLACPVVSIGNLSVGGSGKTPMVAYVARLLLDAGERPAILTRGYGRREAADGVTVVSDGRAILTGVGAAGDEALMLARALPGAAVLVGANRYFAGCFAEARLGTTVHLLDDGFQHLQLRRDVDLLLLAEDDLTDRLMPRGRLREPLAAARAADAAFISAGYPTAVERIARRAGIRTAFRVVRTIGPPHTIAERPDPIVVPPESRVFALAAVARPERFFAEIESAGWTLVGTMAFRDHHAFSRSDIERVAHRARSAAAAIILTTEKDAVRLEGHDLNGVPIGAVPLVIWIDGADQFREWLLGRVAGARQAA